MKVRLLKTVLTGQSDTIPTKKGEIVDFESDADAQEFIDAGLAEKVTGEKKQPEALNKKEADPKNKSVK